MAENGTGNTAGLGPEKIQTDIVTLTRYISEEQLKHPEATGDFTYDIQQREMTKAN